MIISLVAVFGLQGSDRGQLVSKDEAAFQKSFERCIDSKSYAFKNCKRPITVCCFKETNDKNEIHNLTKKVIDNECSNLAVRFAKLANVYLYSGVNTNVKNAENNQWIDQDYTDNKRTTICMVYNIGRNIQQDLDNINQLIEKNKRAPLLVTGTSADFQSVFKVLETSKNVNFEFADKLIELDHEELLKKEKDLAAEDEVAQVYERQLGLIITFKNFVTNRWVITGSLLAAFLAYYYKFAR
jgi:hypothetical protein